ncbi:metabotropic glutamate receptor 2-like isoform X1 [Procambarus clarkii]|uniref:metabotropic glutamate receptor 2-like isoform X1 n=1 Tax=Procambarus clarkii TaxID=6728 RepID=UPI003742ADBC
MARMLLIILVGAVGVTWSLDPAPLSLLGDVTIGVVGDLHGRRGSTGGCGGLSSRAVEQVGAAEWALATINNQSYHDYTIGIRIYDACGDPDQALRQTVRLLQDSQPPQPPLLGVVALGPATVVSGTAAPLHAFNTPIIITDARTAHTIIPADNVFTTAPHLTDQLQAVLSAGVRLGGGVMGVHVVSSCSHASQVLKECASRAGLQILSVLQVENEDNMMKDITDFINNEVSFGGIVILLLSAAELNIFSAEVDNQMLIKSKLHWVLSPLDGEPLAVELSEDELRKKLDGALLVEAHSPVIPGFRQYFAAGIHSNTSVVAPLAKQYMEIISHCDPEAVILPSSSSSASSAPCSRLSVEELTKSVSSSPTTATVKAVSSLAAAFRLVQIERCSTGVHCLDVLRHDLHQDILKALLKLSFTVGGGADRIRYTADGRLVNSFTIKHTTSKGLRQVGVYREDTGVVWTPGETLASEKVERGREGRTLGLVSVRENENNSAVRSVLLTHEDYVGRTWAFSVLVVACLGVVVSLYIAVYVALRICDGTLTGSQVLGAVLLLGVMGLYASCVIYVLPPTSITCAVREWVPPMCLALCYGILLAKSMHLRALVSIGVGGEVSQVNLHVSLLFMVSVQAALCMLGHAGGLLTQEEPLIKIGLDGNRQCGQKRIATLATRVYLLLLLFLTLILATVNRKIQRNHNEGQWLLLTSCVSVPVVAVWSVMSYLAPSALEAPTTSVALLVLASVILGLVFIPKMRIIAQQAKDFRHKRMAATASISTIFTQMEEGPLGGVPALQEDLKPLSSNSPRAHHTHRDNSGSIRSSLASQNSYRAAFTNVYGLPQQSPLTTPRQVMRNHICEASHGAYP